MRTIDAVFANPTPQQLQRLLADGQVSGLLVPHDRLFIWPTAIAGYAEIVARFALPKFVCIDLIMLPDGPIVQGDSAHYRTKAGEYVEQSAVMHRLYGRQIAVLGDRR